MGDRKIVIQTFALPDRGEKHFREISINYDLGGMNYFSYKQKQRGFYINSRVFRRDGAFQHWTMGQPGDGYLFLEEAARFNQKRMRQLVDNAQQHAEKLNQLFDDVANEDRLDTITALVLNDAAAMARIGGL